MINVSESENIENNNNAYFSLWEEKERVTVQHSQPVAATPPLRRIWLKCFLPFIIVLGCKRLESEPQGSHGNPINERILREFENRVRDVAEEEAQVPLRQMDSFARFITLTRELMKILIILMIGFIITLLITYFRNRAH